MHAKTWIIDGAVLLTGSANMTHNGLENNKEHLYKMQGEGVLSPLRADFELQWADSEIVTPHMMELMLATDDARIEKDRVKHQGKVVKRSDSAPVNRSLSGEIERASD